MNELILYRAALVLAAVLETGTAVWLFRQKPEKKARLDRIPRLKMPGIILGFFALLWCVPHARPIVFDWMLPLLYPMVILLTILAWFFLDYLFSRALSGIFILSAYYFVHGAWEFHTPGTPVLSILYWGVGIAGICFSGKPCWMRDWLRACAAKPGYRYGTAVYLFFLAGMSIAAAVLTKGGMA